MATQMTPDLYKAILSMDAYNRGYGASIKFGNLSGNNSIDSPGTTIGVATVFRANGDAAAQSIGFYGIAYQLSSIPLTIFPPHPNPLPRGERG